MDTIGKDFFNEILGWDLDIILNIFTVHQPLITIEYHISLITRHGIYSLTSHCYAVAK